MEQNSNTDNFEQLLRDTTDEFRMYPSKRVWHSIYNDLHPSRKWPSLAILLLLITSIMYVGITNSNEAGSVAQVSGSNDAIKTAGEQIAVNETGRSTDVTPVRESGSNGDDYTAFAKTAVSQTGITVPAQRTGITASPENNGATGKFSVRSDNRSNMVQSGGTTEMGNEYSYVQPDASAVTRTASINTGSRINEVNTTKAKTKADFINSSADAGSLISEIPSTLLYNSTNATPADNKKATVSNTTKAVVKSNELKTSIDDKSWMDNDVLHNKKIARKWKNRLAYEVYVTPSLGYRTLKKNTGYSVTPAASLIANPGQTNAIDYSFNHSSAINLEAGSSIVFAYSKKLRFKAGMQFNYTNYRINAYELNHPTFTTLMLNDLNFGYPVLELRTTNLSNTPGPASRNLNNNTYQFSLPVGADFKIAGKNKIKWYAGATVQPTYISGGHSYLISSDLKNYVSGETFMRKFNLNGGIETFVSYQTANGVTVSAGPQLRYQFLSTYNKEYTYDEKLYNLGIKLGITTNF